MASKPEFRVAICGAGIGGLALAAFLSKSSNNNIHIDIYESKEQVSTIGTALAVWKRTWEVLRDLGFEKDLVENGMRVPTEGKLKGPEFRYSQTAGTGAGAGDVVGKIIHSQILPFGLTSIPRTILFRILQSKLNPTTCKIHCSKKLERHEEVNEGGGGLVLHFENGEKATADILVGCDGVHSAVRATMFDEKKFAEPVFSGTLAYRFQVSQEALREVDSGHEALSGPKVWCGKGRHVVSHPYANVIDMTCFVTLPPSEYHLYTSSNPENWVLAVNKDQVIDHFPPSKWESQLNTLLQTPVLVPPGSGSKIERAVSRWAIYVTDRNLPFATKGCVALVGDAAHAMTPHQGSGGGQAIEDGYVLANLLMKVTTSQKSNEEPEPLAKRFEEILKVYSKIRLPFAQEIARRSDRNGRMYEFLPLEGDGGDRPVEDLEELSRVIGESFVWLGEGGAEEGLEEAEEEARKWF